MLRPLREAEADAYAAAFTQDPDLARQLGLDEDPTPDGVRDRLPELEEARTAGRFLQLAVAGSDDDAFLGEVMLHSLVWRHERAEVAFWLVPRARGCGLAGGAVSLLVDWAFNGLGLARIEMTTLPDNAATHRLAERLGFSEEGTMRSRNFERGVRVDVVMFGLLRDEWRR